MNRCLILLSSMSDTLVFYTTKNICEILKVKKLIVFSSIYDCKLQAVRINRNFKIEKAEFDKFIHISN